MKALAVIFVLASCGITFAQQAEEKKNSSDTVKTRLICLPTINNNQPQYIVNGVEVCPEDISKIDPNQIESINVIKGTVDNRPDGERKKNGVILIEMKKSRKEEPKDKL